MIYWCISATHVNFNLSVTLWLFKKNPIKAQFPPTIHALFWESLTATTDETDDAFSVHTMPPCCPNIPVIAVSGWFTYLQRKTLDVSTPLLPSHHPQPRIFMKTSCAFIILCDRSEWCTSKTGSMNITIPSVPRDPVVTSQTVIIKVPPIVLSRADSFFSVFAFVALLCIKERTALWYALTCCV